MARPGGLGRGLSSLIPVDPNSADDTAEEGDGYRELPLDSTTI